MFSTTPRSRIGSTVTSSSSSNSRMTASAAVSPNSIPPPTNR
jgi:hypothetical protein